VEESSLNRSETDTERSVVIKSDAVLQYPLPNDVLKGSSPAIVLW